jgi:hypothetical protein
VLWVGGQTSDGDKRWRNVDVRAWSVVMGGEGRGEYGGEENTERVVMKVRVRGCVGEGVCERVGGRRCVGEGV